MGVAPTALGIRSAAMDSINALETDFLDYKKVQEAVNNVIESNSDQVRLLKQTALHLAGDILDLAEATA